MEDMAVSDIQRPREAMYLVDSNIVLECSAG